MIIGRGWRLRDVAAYIGPSLIVLLAWDVLITVLYVRFGLKWVAVTDLPMPLIGTALALLVTMRNNNAYARWWEARQLWGGIVNNSRTFARQVRLFLPSDPSGNDLITLQVAYAQALRCHLRKQDPLEEIVRLVSAEVRARLAGSANVPDALLGEIADGLADLHGAGQLDTVQLAAFERTLAELANMQGGAERIKNTPLPRQYALFPRVFARVFCVLLPLALVTELRWMTPLGSTLLGFIFLSLDRIGQDLENPFENGVYDMPMTSITRTIEINLRQGQGRSDVPKPVEPENGVLW